MLAREPRPDDPDSSRGVRVAIRGTGGLTVRRSVRNGPQARSAAATPARATEVRAPAPSRHVLARRRSIIARPPSCLGDKRWRPSHGTEDVHAPAVRARGDRLVERHAHRAAARRLPRSASGGRGLFRGAHPKEHRDDLVHGQPVDPVVVHAPGCERGHRQRCAGTERAPQMRQQPSIEGALRADGVEVDLHRGDARQRGGPGDGARGFRGEIVGERRMAGAGLDARDGDERVPGETRRG